MVGDWRVRTVVGGILVSNQCPQVGQRAVGPVAGLDNHTGLENNVHQSGNVLAAAGRREGAKGSLFYARESPQ